MTLLRPDTRHASLSQLTASPSQPLHFTAPVCTSLRVHSHFIRGCGNTSFPSFVSALTVCTLEGLPLGDNLPACLTFSCFFSLCSAVLLQREASESRNHTAISICDE